MSFENHRIAVGVMNFGGRTPEPEAQRIVDRALDQGVSWFDVANVYNRGESERILGRALRGRRDRAIVATKVGLDRVRDADAPAGTPRRPEGLSGAVIRRAIDESLSRLGMDYVDIYYLHAPDHGTPLEESLAALAELRRAGKIRRFGVSNHASWQVLEMCLWCDAHGEPRPAVSQLLYNVLVRQLEIEYLRFAAKYQVPTTVYNALAGGLLSGKYLGRRPEDGALPGTRFENNDLYQRRYFTGRVFEHVTALSQLAREAGMTLMDLAYAWLAGRPGVTSVLIGPASAEHLDSAVSALARRLPSEVEKRVDDLHQAFMGTDARYAR
jgi:aryl-alcohol dehydrogenase-like predicted oxidoreductase